MKISGLKSEISGVTTAASCVLRTAIGLKVKKYACGIKGFVCLLSLFTNDSTFAVDLNVPNNGNNRYVRITTNTIYDNV
ncbi:MAG: hypothetical protein J6X32_02425, partial [Salinivirgaceae bacterium]|nr:hypothetical protein [Salinivirgaceae bacterium]